MSELSEISKYIIEQAKENIAFAKQSKNNVPQAATINRSLSTITAQCRNEIVAQMVNKGRKSWEIAPLPDPVPTVKQQTSTRLQGFTQAMPRVQARVQARAPCSEQGSHQHQEARELPR